MHGAAKRIHLNVILPICAWVLQVGPFAQSFPTKTLHAPLFSIIRATCLTHLILSAFVLREQVFFMLSCGL